MAPATRGTQQFCPDCGSKVTRTQRFCRSCGADLQASAEETEEVPAPARAGRRGRSPEATAPLPEQEATPAPDAAQAVPPPAAGDAGAPAWPAWVGAAACGVLVIATGLQWFGGVFTADSYDVPLAALFSDRAAGGVPVGVVFVLAGAAGLAVALIRPDDRVLSVGFLSAGAAATVFILWYIVRVLATTRGAPLSHALSIGVWLALLASLAILAAGFILRFAPSRR